jgi:hypothetical protein
MMLSPNMAVRIPIVNGKIIIYDDFILAMATKTKDWQALTKGILKGELKRRNLSYADLAERLAALGIHDNDKNIANKIARGSFTATFLIQCFAAIGAKTIHLEE